MLNKVSDSVLYNATGVKFGEILSDKVKEKYNLLNSEYLDFLGRSSFVYGLRNLESNLNKKEFSEGEILNYIKSRWKMSNSNNEQKEESDNKAKDILCDLVKNDFVSEKTWFKGEPKKIFRIIILSSEERENKGLMPTYSLQVKDYKK